MSTEATPVDTDDWGEPDETDSLEYSPDPAYLGDRHFYRVVGWGLVAVVTLYEPNPNEWIDDSIRR